MILLLFWTFFVFSLSLAKELDQFHYLLSSLSMLCSIYLYDQVSPLKISLRTNICLLLIPSIIFWYIAFVFNGFLCLTPISHEILVSLLFIHTYILIYVFWEYP
uniref:Uncharacterized protein n=1 Tax=Cylindrotheca closterium TaxID=2856 RepID=A0A2U9GHV4_9STRA|nr:hypothetical protein [Cylindrotheca closterium]AWQ64056.1 hypothetical protein [Cylindrotheca closterium]